MPEPSWKHMKVEHFENKCRFRSFASRSETVSVFITNENHLFVCRYIFPKQKWITEIILCVCVHVLPISYSFLIMILNSGFHCFWNNQNQMCTKFKSSALEDISVLLLKRPNTRAKNSQILTIIPQRWLFPQSLFCKGSMSKKEEEKKQNRAL